MASRRRRSLLEDDVVELGRSEPSSGDVCERCGHTRAAHAREDGGCDGGRGKCKCDGFEGDLEGTRWA